jgi:hypothetical protein
MMGGGVSPAPVEQEIATIKDMLQQLMDAQIAMMQMLGGGALPPPGSPPPMDPAMMGVPPGMNSGVDPAMMGVPPGMNGGVDPAMMGLPPAGPSPEMIAQASVEDDDFNAYIKTITDLLR